MSPRTSGVYSITNKANGKRYVGSSKHIENRWAVHRKRLRDGTHHSAALQNAWKKYGEDSFVFDIVEIADASILIDREQFHIDSLGTAERNRGYNILKNAYRPVGYRHTDEARAKMSLAGFGKPKSREHRYSIKAALLGRKPSQQAIDAKIAYFTGRKQTPELIEKRAKANRGAKRNGIALENLRNTAVARQIFDEDDCISIANERSSGATISSLARKYGCSRTPIKRALERVQ